MTIVLAITTITSAFADGIANGDLTGVAGAASVPAGWSQYIGNTSDTTDENGPYGACNLSPNGGTFVRSRSSNPLYPSLDQQEGITQLVTGLIPGARYVLTFYQSSLNSTNSITGEPVRGAEGFWEILLDGSVVADSTPQLPPPGTSLNNSWGIETIQFDATANEHNLGFRAQASAPTNTITAMGIDGIALTQVPAPEVSIAELRMSGSHIVLNWQPTQSHLVYLIEACTNLTQANWAPIAPTSQWWISETTWTNTNWSGGQTFFRIKTRTR